ncbi:hypothetical protein KUCAC02_011765, partial [Chaenocephalus aceratus]
ADTWVNCHVTRYFDVCADSPACQGCFTHKEGTSEQDGEVNREIDGHHLLGPCIICHCHCCQNTDCCFSPLNVIANDAGYVPKATNGLFLWGLVSRPDTCFLSISKFSITLSLPSIALPLSSSVSVSLGSASGIKKGMGGDVIRTQSC